MDEIDLLYGEALFFGDGYFHRVDSTTGAVGQQDCLAFRGGLADAAYGYNNHIDVTSGGGKNIYERM